MARASRRKTSVNENAVKSEILSLSTGVYVRLSREKDGDSSIQSQISMLHKYVKETPELHLTDTYVDNGFTGTNFDRPEFERMMNDVYNGKIQCIVVKDLSRFGRNLIEAGNYIENIFPKLGVRFIALTDSFDNSHIEDVNSIAIPVKNMVNAMYARDLSKKQVASFELHSRLGDKKITSVPYGYLLNKAENRLEPHPETAPILKLIFKWYLHGVGTNEIAHRLNDFHVATPNVYSKNRGEGSWRFNSIV